MPKITMRCVDCGKERTAWPSYFKGCRGEEYRCKKCAIKNLFQSSLWVENNKSRCEVRSRNATWRKNNKKHLEKINSDPIIKEKHAVAVKELSKDLKWLENNKKVLDKIHNDPECKTNHKNAMEKLFKDPEWIKKVIQGVTKRESDPEYIKNRKGGAKKRSEDPKWLEKQIVNNRKLSQDPEWLEKMKRFGNERPNDINWRENHLVGVSGQGFWYGHPTINREYTRFNYCEIFDQIKPRVRAFFNKTCTKCGSIEIDGSFNVHHVFYEKKTCCWIDSNGEYWTNLNAVDHKEKDYYIGNNPNYFVLLCNSCHGTTNGKYENRKKSADKLRKLIDEKYNGKSYYSEEEMIGVGYKKISKTKWIKI